MMNKKGAELTVTTIILIVLGVLILVFLIIGFSIGWNRIFPYINPSNNVDDVLRLCQSACNSGSKYNFCTSLRDVKVDNDIMQAGVAVTVGKKLTASCFDLSAVQALGLPKCPSIDCEGYSTENYAKLACDTDSKQLLSGKKAATDKDSFNVVYLDRDNNKIDAHCALK